MVFEPPHVALGLHLGITFQLLVIGRTNTNGQQWLLESLPRYIPTYFTSRTASCIAATKIRYVHSYKLKPSCPGGSQNRHRPAASAAFLTVPISSAVIARLMSA